MPVFRMHKEKDFTTVLNDFIKDRKLSLKGKGLMITMLSLPDNWDFSERGLSAICKEGREAIHNTLKELEELGYLVRRQLRDERGLLIDVEYNIYERSVLRNNQNAKKPATGYPAAAEPAPDRPAAVLPDTGIPAAGNPNQVNTHQSNTKKSNTHKANPIESTPSGSERNGTDGITKRILYEEIIKENIGFDLLIKEHPLDREMIEEITELLLDTVCSARKTIRVAGDDVPVEAVRSRLLKIDGEHIQYVIDCLKENTTAIRNIKQYMLASLYNAPLTMGNYYLSRVNHDMAEAEE